MKKNITINLYGRLYHIDEDAYQLISQYLDSMRRHFAGREGGDEITDDIERRVAELLDETSAQGSRALCIDDVQGIMQRVGRPEQMDGGDEEAAGGGASEEQKKKPHRRLYRDADDRIVGGVVSGLCHYFGLSDPLPARIVVVLLCFLSFSVVLVLYLALWVLTPEAVTPEQKLEMRGEPVNPATLADEAVYGFNCARQYASNPTTRAQARGCLAGGLRVIVLFVKILAILVLACVLLAALIVFGMALAYLLFGSNVLVQMAPAEPVFMAYASSHPSFFYWLMALSLLSAAVCGIPLYVLLRNLLGGSNRRPAAPTARVAWLIVWLLSLVALITTATVGGVSLGKALDEYNRLQNTREGVYVDKDSWNLLDNNGWRLTKTENLDPDATRWETDPRTGEDVDCLDLLQGDEDGLRPLFRLSRTVRVEPGAYLFSMIYKIDAGKAVRVCALDSAGNVLAAGYADDSTQAMQPATAGKTAKVVVSDGSNSVTVQAGDADANWRHLELPISMERGGNIEIRIEQQRPDLATGRATGRLIMLEAKVEPAKADDKALSNK